MRKSLLAVLLMVAVFFGGTHSVYAESVTAANIFQTIGGTTTIDRGGSIHSQARSIYSLGGGMTSFQGKRVSLLAADPPSFSAGCSGISWHFGGFAFISVDEIRQLVEAVAQASLGVAVDLAMQTLCPQCYAVMAKLRDIANAMRNAAADACKIAKNFGSMLQKEGVFSADSSITSCSQASADAGDSDSFMGASLSPCKLLNDAEDKLSGYGNNVLSFLQGGSNSVSNTPTKDQLDAVGNMSYEALSALGYTDGFVKDFLLSYTGMAIIDPVPGKDCRGAFTQLFGSAPNDTDQGTAVASIIGSQPEDAVAAPSSTAGATPANAQTTDAKTQTTQATKGHQTCFAPPLITGVQEAAMKMVCGFNPQGDMTTFSRKFGLDMAQLGNSSLGAMCRTVMLNQGPMQLSLASHESQDPWMYHCLEMESSRCMRPTMVRMSDAVGLSVSNSEYTGLAWFVLDALYAGVEAVQNNTPLPPNTIAILNGSGYPLYRLINLAAVYPGMADELLQAYGSIIAIHYVLDTLQKVGSPGQLPGIDTRAGKGGLQRQEVVDLRRHIMDMLHDGGEVREQVMKRLSEKRNLVDTIVQVNRALQAEVISQGLGGNADLAVSIKRQASQAGATQPTTP